MFHYKVLWGCIFPPVMFSFKHLTQLSNCQQNSAPRMTEEKGILCWNSLSFPCSEIVTARYSQLTRFTSRVKSVIRDLEKAQIGIERARRRRLVQFHRKTPLPPLQDRQTSPATPVQKT